MTDEKVPPGSTVAVNLRRKRPPEKIEEITTPSRGIIPIDSETPRYLRRPQAHIIFLDLATRLRSVPPTIFTGNRIRLSTDTESPARNDDYFNEYVEQVYELARTPATRLTLYTQEQIAQLTAALLGSRTPGSTDTLDPFATTPANVTGRKLHNCMPLPHRAGNLQTWIGVNDGEYHLADGTIDDGAGGGLWTNFGAQEWKEREARPAEDASERWNPLNLRLTSAPHRAGRLTPKGAIKRVRLLYPFVENYGDIWGAYERFDTHDPVNYKLTNLPSFSAEEVTFSAGRGDLRVYLVPRMILHNFTTGEGTPYYLFNRYRWHSRKPVYPDDFTPSQVSEVSQFFRCFIERSPLAGQAFRAVTPTTTPGYFSAQFNEFGGEYPASISRTGMLAAALVQGSRVWYVWRRTDAPLDPLAAFNPYSGGLSVDTPCE